MKIIIYIIYLELTWELGLGDFRAPQCNEM